MDFWQLELDTLTVGSVVGVVELKGQPSCMSFVSRFPSWGVWAKLSPGFWGEIFPKVEKKKRPPVLSRAEKNGEKKTGGILCDDFCGVIFEGCRCVNPFIDVR